MADPLFIVVGYLVHIVTCFSLIRPTHHIVVRAVLTLVPCIVLTHIGCRDLPLFSMFSIFVISAYWMISMRLIHLTVLSPDTFPTFRSFIFKCLWIFFPIVRCESIEKQWPIIFDLISAGVKLIMNQWMHKWLLTCEPSDSYPRMIMFYLSMLTASYLVDVQAAFIRIITRDKYTVQSFHNFSLLSQSLREYWGRRHSRIAGIVLKESIFQPLHSYIHSPLIVSMITFIVSGLLHVHIVIVAFNDVPSALPTFAFFFLHGIACCIEPQLGIRRLSPLLGWFVTHSFILLTAPLGIGPFTRSGSAFLNMNEPLFLDKQWIPQLPVPKTCPK